MRVSLSHISFLSSLPPSVVLSASHPLTVREHCLADVLGLPTQRHDNPSDIAIRENLANIVQVRYRTLLKTTNDMTFSDMLLLEATEIDVPQQSENPL